MASRRPLFRAAALTLLTASLLSACGGADLDEQTSPSAETGGVADPRADSGASGTTGNTAADDTGSNAGDAQSGSDNGEGDAGSSTNQTPVTPVPLTTYATEMLSAVNANRSAGANCGGQVYPPTTSLSWDANLEQAALGHSEYLRDTNTFSHSGANGSTIGTRVTATGYEWSAVGENIAAGYPSIASVVQGWMNSSGHCRNIMSPGFAQLGVAVVNGEPGNTYGTYWTMVLAQPR